MKRLTLGFSLLLAVVASGCAAKTKSPYRAFQQQEEADLVVGFWHWDSWRVEKPAVREDRYLTVLTKQQFLDKLEHLHPRREFVVIILDKRASPAGKGASLEELESFFQGLGFRRVVIQLAVGDDNPDGLPILKDPGKKT